VEAGGHAAADAYARPRFVDALTAYNVTRVSLTAALLANGTLLQGRAAATAHARAPVPRSLWFVHGHRHREEWSLHGAALALSRASFLNAHVLLFCTDVTMHAASLVRALRLYPHRSPRLLIHTGVTTGYRCGLLHSIAISAHVWWRYTSVMFSHPDVYLLPPATVLLEQSLTASPLAAFLGTSTRMFWYGRRRPSAVLSDLFAFRPALLPEGALGPRRDESTNERAGPQWTRVHAGYPGAAYFHNASAECTFSMRRGNGLLKPEMALARAHMTLGARFKELTSVARTERRRGIARSGVWHTHNTSAVRSAICDAERYSYAADSFASLCKPSSVIRKWW
jgi:hypothetical protein